MTTDTARFIIDEDSTDVCSFAELMRANQHCEYLRRLLKALKVDGSDYFGGGAGATFKITRVQ